MLQEEGIVLVSSSVSQLKPILAETQQTIRVSSTGVKAVDNDTTEQQQHVLNRSQGQGSHL